jgi:hypothetical protein
MLHTENKRAIGVVLCGDEVTLDTWCRTHLILLKVDQYHRLYCSLAKLFVVVIRYDQFLVTNPLFSLHDDLIEYFLGGDSTVVSWPHLQNPSATIVSGVCRKFHSALSLTLDDPDAETFYEMLEKYKTSHCMTSLKQCFSLYERKADLFFDASRHIFVINPFPRLLRSTGNLETRDTLKAMSKFMRLTTGNESILINRSDHLTKALKLPLKPFYINL